MLLQAHPACSDTPTGTRPTAHRVARLALVLGMLGLLGSLGAHPLSADEAPTQAALPAPDVIDGAIDRGVAWLMEEQRPDGTWASGSRALGHTLLAVYALQHAGVRETQTTRTAKRYRRAWSWLDRTGPGRSGRADGDPGTYALSLLILALLERDREVDHPRLRRLARLLTTTQCANGQWDYKSRPDQSVGDNSNTQFAVLALARAHAAGHGDHAAVLRRARDWWVRATTVKGGVGYGSGGSTQSTASGSMTAAALACMAAIDAALEQPFAASRDARDRAHGWLGLAFVPHRNPGPTPNGTRERQRKAGRGWLHYHLWTVERAMVLHETSRLGAYDWYAAGAAHLVAKQRRDGSWRGEHPLYATSFALLFLSRAADPPRAFTRSGSPTTRGPVSGTPKPPPEDAPDAPEDDTRPEGTLADWLDATLPPGELARRVRLLGPGALPDLVRALGDPEAKRRQRALEALGELLPAQRMARIDRHPLPRARLLRWLRGFGDSLVLRDGRYVEPAEAGA